MAFGLQNTESWSNYKKNIRQTQIEGYPSKYPTRTPRNWQGPQKQGKSEKLSLLRETGQEAWQLNAMERPRTTTIAKGHQGKTKEIWVKDGLQIITMYQHGSWSDAWFSISHHFAFLRWRTSPLTSFSSYRVVTQQWYRHLLSGHIVVHPGHSTPRLYLWWRWFSCSVTSNSCDLMGSSPPGSSVHEISFPGQEYWSGLPLPLPCFIFRDPQGRIALQLYTKVRIIL